MFFIFVKSMFVMKERLSIIMADEQITASKLAAMLEVQPSAISHIMSGRNKPSYDFIIKLMTAFPRYNIEWLLLGTGDRFKSNNVVPVLVEEPVLPLSGESSREELIDFEEASSKAPEGPKDDPEELNTSHVSVTNSVDVEVASASNHSVIEEDKHPVEKSKEQQGGATVSNSGVTKVLVFYQDHTFEEYAPRK